MTDKEAIEKVIADYVKYWNKNDMDSWGRLFTEDVDYVNRGGGWWQSNKENMEGHKRIHDMMVKQNQTMTFNLDVRNITFLKPDIALVHALSEWPGFKFPGPDQEPGNVKGIITFVIIKKVNGWLIRALHNTLRAENSH